jgi:hypothetical protein
MTGSKMMTLISVVLNAKYSLVTAVEETDFDLLNCCHVEIEEFHRCVVLGGQIVLYSRGVQQCSSHE